ncbi:hypothetical protein ACUSIJ_12400 [Pseudochelatococcus sp. B33]
MSMLLIRPPLQWFTLKDGFCHDERSQRPARGHGDSYGTMFLEAFILQPMTPSLSMGFQAQWKALIAIGIRRQTVCPPQRKPGAGTWISGRLPRR